jgi:hypothetical protein
MNSYENAPPGSVPPAMAPHTAPYHHNNPHHMNHQGAMGDSQGAMVPAPLPQTSLDFDEMMSVSNQPLAALAGHAGAYPGLQGPSSSSGSNGNTGNTGNTANTSNTGFDVKSHLKPSHSLDFEKVTAPDPDAALPIPHPTSVRTSNRPSKSRPVHPSADGGSNASNESGVNESKSSGSSTCLFLTSCYHYCLITILVS